MDVGNGVGEIALVCIASDHRKSSWECRQGGVASIWIKQVITLRVLVNFFSVDESEKVDKSRNAGPLEI